MTEKNILDNFKYTFYLVLTKKFLLMFAFSLFLSFFVTFYFALSLVDTILDWLLSFFSIELDKESILNYFYNIARFILSWLIFSFLALPFSNILCGLIGDYIFDSLPNRNQITLRKSKNSFFKSMIFSIKAAIINLLINLLILPFYFILPGINYAMFVAINGFLLGRELSGCFVVQFDNIDLTSFYNKISNSLFLSGALFTILITIPIVRYAVPFFAIVFYAKLVLDFFQQEKEIGK